MIVQDLLTGLVLGVIIGVFSGCVASLIFWRYILLQKPKMKIKEEIAKAPSKFDPHQFTYRVGILNLKKRPVLNVRFEVAAEKRVPAKGGKFKMEILMIPTKPENRLFIAEGTGMSFEPDLHNQDFLNELSFRFSSDKDFIERMTERPQLEDLLAKFDSLRVRIMATDPMSNVSGVFSQRFTIKDIVEGEFSYKPFEINLV